MDKGKKVKVEKEEENDEGVDFELVHSIEKLQECQDKLEKGRRRKVEKEEEKEEEEEEIDLNLVSSIEKLQECQDELEKWGVGMMDKGKKARVEEREEQKEKENEENEEEIDLDLVSSIEKLQDCQDELEKLNDEASDKVLEVEQKYNEIRRPFYNKRNAVIQTIPDFWLTAFLSHPVLSEILTEEDQKVFKYLQSLDVEDFKDVKSGYKITLTFRANPYFEDSDLTKVFQFFDDGTTSIIGTKPRWKGGMDLTNGFAPEKEGNKRAFIQDSFFKWLSTGERKDASEDFHDEVAEIIKDDLWPDPLKYFNNEADDEDEDDDEGDEGDEEEQGNGDGEEEDNDDDEDEDDDE